MGKKYQGVFTKLDLYKILVCNLEKADQYLQLERNQQKQQNPTLQNNIRRTFAFQIDSFPLNHVIL
jgi:hypothetical protein